MARHWVEPWFAEWPVCVYREFEGTTTAREAYTGAAGERAARIVRDSELTSGNRKAKLSVRIGRVGVVLDGGSCVRARFLTDVVVGVYSS